MRAGALAAVAALAASVGGVGCHASIATEKPIPIRPIATPAMQTIDGALALPQGDQTHISVVEADGRRTVLVVSQSMMDGLGPGAKTGARVRVIGEPATLNGASAIRVTSIMLVP